VRRSPLGNGTTAAGAIMRDRRGGDRQALSPRRLAPTWCLALVTAYLAVAFLLHVTAIAPWWIAVVLFHGGALLIWVRTGGRLRGLLARGEASWWLLLLAVALAVGTGVATMAASHLLGLQELAAPTDLADVVVVALVAVVIGGLLNALPEEATFRGVFLRSFDSAWGPRWAVAASGILFGLAHLPNVALSWELTGATLAVRLVHLAAVGALLAWVVLRTGTIWVAVLWHAGTNQVGVMAELFGASTPSLTAAQQSWDLVFLAGEVVLLWLLVRYGWQRRGGRVADTTAVA